MARVAVVDARRPHRVRRPGAVRSLVVTVRHRNDVRFRLLGGGRGWWLDLATLASKVVLPLVVLVLQLGGYWHVEWRWRSTAVVGRVQRRVDLQERVVLVPVNAVDVVLVGVALLQARHIPDGMSQSVAS